MSYFEQFGSGKGNFKVGGDRGTFSQNEGN